MNRSFTTVCLATAVAWIMGDMGCAEEVALNFKKIDFEYVEQHPGGTISFGGTSAFPALPANFFGPGSDPFMGDVLLKGKKILENLVLEREEGAVFDPPSAPQDIPLEIVALDLVSAQPIVVTYSDGLTEQWDLTLNLNRNEKSSCWMRVSHFASAEPDGGAILPAGSFFDISAEVTFTHTPSGGASRHRFFAIIDRSNLTTSDAKWAHRNDAIAGGANREFIPGADPANPTAPPQILFFEGGGLNLPLRVVDVVPEPSTIMHIALGMAWLGFGARTRS